MTFKCEVEAAGVSPLRGAGPYSGCIVERDHIGWQRASGCGSRAFVGADISRWKRVIGDGLCSQTGGWQAAEVAIATDVLNRMLNLRRPSYIRVA
jgi:hypothetical protein